MNITPTNEERILRVLVVDEDESVLRVFTNAFECLESNELHLAHTLAEARRLLEEVMIDIAFIAPRLPPDLQQREGITLLQEIRGRYQTMPIMMGKLGRPEDIHEALSLGAEDCMLDTEVAQRVPLILKQLRRKLEAEEALLDLRARGAPDSNLGLIGTSVVMRHLRTLIHRVATASLQEPVPVLILGPTGSGKELVAQAIHKLGPHSSEPFFDINCSALAETLIESQLFGYVRGAFTDAARDQDGYFTLVRRGTLFLDEVAELSPALQAKLLRVLETRRFRPVGPTAREQLFQGRIVAATHVDLKERVRQGLFREDLFHRLNVLLIRVPPLSNRREDIPSLVQHFAAKHRRPLHFTPSAIELLCRHPWPGNVRELRNAIYRLAILADSERIDAETVEQHLPQDSDDASDDELPGLLREMARKLLALPLQDKIDAITEALVQEALAQAHGTCTEAGRKLGRHRKFVERSIKKRSGSGMTRPKR